MDINRSFLLVGEFKTRFFIIESFLPDFNADFTAGPIKI